MNNKSKWDERDKRAAKLKRSFRDATPSDFQRSAQTVKPKISALAVVCLGLGAVAFGPNVLWETHIKPLVKGSEIHMRFPEAGTYRVHALPDLDGLRYPLEIKRPDTQDNAVIRIRKWEGNETIITAYLAPGGGLEIPMPAGRYKVTVASGSRWLGEGHLFGKGTKTYQVETPVTILRDQKLTLELSPRVQGNLAMKQVSDAAF